MHCAREAGAKAPPECECECECQSESTRSQNTVCGAVRSSSGISSIIATSSQHHHGTLSPLSPRFTLHAPGRCSRLRLRLLHGSATGMRTSETSETSEPAFSCGCPVQCRGEDDAEDAKISAGASLNRNGCTPLSHLAPT